MSVREEALNIFNNLDEDGLKEFIETFEWAVHEPNEETLEAMKEAEDVSCDPNAPTFDSVDDLMAELLA